MTTFDVIYRKCQFLTNKLSSTTAIWQNFSHGIQANAFTVYEQNSITFQHNDLVIYIVGYGYMLSRFTEIDANLAKESS